MTVELIDGGEAAMIKPATETINMAVSFGLHDSWTIRRATPIHKQGSQSEVSDYRIIMSGHTDAQLLGSLLESDISDWAEQNSKWVVTQAGFGRNHCTLDHLLALRVLWEKAKVDKPLFCIFIDFARRSIPSHE